MNLSAPFIQRPVATTLLSIAIVLAGLLAYMRLPVSPLPQVDFPTISVSASLPGASPETVATSVASPLERHLGQIADVTEMTSQSSVGSARVTLQFGLNRDINGAARDVQAAINAARADLPTSLRSNPTYRKVNPADAPVLILGLTSKTLTRGQMYDAATNVLQQRLSQLEGVGQVIIGGAAQPAVRVELNPLALNQLGIGLEDVRAALASANANSPKGSIEIDNHRLQLDTNDQADVAADYRPLVIAYRNGAAGAPVGRGRCRGFRRGRPQRRAVQRAACGAGHHLPRAGRQHPRRGLTGERRDPATQGGDADRSGDHPGRRPHADHPRQPARHRTDPGDRRRPGDAGGAGVPAQLAHDDDPRHRGADQHHRHVRARCGCWATAWTISR